eukprot:Platyproteum_vivax@DN5675_c0_g1_i1.p3
MDKLEEAKTKAQLEQLQSKQTQQQQAQKDAQEERQQTIEEQKRVMLRQVLDTEASERLHRVELVKPEKAKAVKDYILQQATRGAITNKVDDTQLIGILERVSAMENVQKSSVVTIRRKVCDDSDDDLGLI